MAVRQRGDARTTSFGTDLLRTKGAASRRASLTTGAKHDLQWPYDVANLCCGMDGPLTFSTFTRRDWLVLLLAPPAAFAVFVLLASWAHQLGMPVSSSAKGTPETIGATVVLILGLALALASLGRRDHPVAQRLMYVGLWLVAWTPFGSPQTYAWMPTTALALATLVVVVDIATPYRWMAVVAGAWAASETIHAVPMIPAAVALVPFYIMACLVILGLSLPKAEARVAGVAGLVLGATGGLTAIVFLALEPTLGRLQMVMATAAATAAFAWVLRSKGSAESWTRWLSAARPRRTR